MGGRDQKKKRQGSSSPSLSGASARGTPSSKTPTWMQTHGRDLRFLIIFSILMGIYYVFTTTAMMKERFFPWYLDFNARASVAVLKTFGYDDISRDGTTLHSPVGSITVERGCDAAEPSALFAAAVLASPVVFSSKIVAVVVGVLILAVVNLVRIITLFLTAAHWKAAFDVMHLEVWQAVFIFLAILLWAFWASWAVQRQRRAQIAASNVSVP